MSDTYKILTQRQNTVINPQGNNFMNVWEVTYQVTSGPARGVTGTVEIPESDHNAKYVGDAIETQITNLAEVHSLGGM